MKKISIGFVFLLSMGIQAQTGITTGTPSGELHVDVGSDGSTANDFIVTTAGDVGARTITPNASAKLDLNSSTQGLLFPRMTNAQMNAIASPVEGLMVYSTDSKCTYFYDGAAWSGIGQTSTAYSKEVTGVTSIAASGAQRFELMNITLPAKQLVSVTATFTARTPNTTAGTHSTSSYYFSLNGAASTVTGENETTNRSTTKYGFVSTFSWTVVVPAGPCKMEFVINNTSTSTAINAENIRIDGIVH